MTILLDLKVTLNLTTEIKFSTEKDDHVCNICKTCFTQMHDHRWVRQYLTDEAAILAANV